MTLVILLGELKKISGALGVLLERVEHIEKDFKDMKEGSNSVSSNRSAVRIPLIIRVC